MTPLQRFTGLLGDDVFFVPCIFGTKKPREKYSQRPFEETKSPEYLASFNSESTNIAVYLGNASGGLCAIDCDADEDLAAFLEANPNLMTTTRSRGSRGGMLWVRVTGEFPKSCKSERFEWRADGNLSMIHGRHPKGMDYQLVRDTAPVALAFDEIVWPDGWERPWKDDDESNLWQTYGDPFFVNKNGGISTINEAYWAGLYATENIILYEPDEKTFYRYSGDTGIYEVESTDSIRIKISARMLEASRQANAFDLEKKRGATTLNNIISYLRGTVEQRGAFKERRKVVHLANGVMVFTGAEAELRPFSPEYRSRNRSPISFDLNAKCDRFLNELVQPAVHTEDVELLQKFAGMMLLGDNRAQRLLILDGEGGRGKTQFANVMRGLVGMQNVTELRTKHLAERFELYRFLTKTLLVGVDVEPDFLSAKGAAVLKGLVGGDWHDAEQKGGTGCFQVQGNFNVLITSNARLRVRLQGDLSAWKRRLTIVRYEAPPPVLKIPDFGAFLVRTEGSGILNWALIGAGKLLSEMPDSGGDMVMTPRQNEVVDSLMAESDSLRHFLRDCLAVDEHHDVTVTELVEAYAAYCPGRKWQPLPITEVQSKLETLMLEIYGRVKRHDIKRKEKGQRGFNGVAFR